MVTVQLLQRTAVDPSKETRRNPNGYSTTRDTLPVGKRATSCWTAERERRAQEPPPQQQPQREQHPRWEGRYQCYNCGQRGHIATRCLSNATMFGDSATSESGTPLQQVSREDSIEGTSVTDILLDSGASSTMVRLDLVLQGRMVEGEVLIKCAHGDCHTVYCFNFVCS